MFAQWLCVHRDGTSCFVTSEKIRSCIIQLHWDPRNRKAWVIGAWFARLGYVIPYPGKFEQKERLFWLWVYSPVQAIKHKPVTLSAPNEQEEQDDEKNDTNLKNTRKHENWPEADQGSVLFMLLITLRSVYIHNVRGLVMYKPFDEFGRPETLMKSFLSAVQFTNQLH